MIQTQLLLLSLITLLITFKLSLAQFTPSDCIPGETKVNESIMYECFTDGKTKGIRPKACLNEIGLLMEPGESWTGVYFIYNCTKPDPSKDLLSYDIAACLTPTGSEILIGDTVNEGGGVYTCILNSNSSVTRHFQAKTMCLYDRMEVRVGHIVEDRNYNITLECAFINGQLQMYAKACILFCDEDDIDNNTGNCSATVTVGRTTARAGNIYKCERNGTNPSWASFKLTYNNCSEGSNEHEIGDEWTKDNFLYKCELKGLNAHKIIKKCIFHPHASETLSIGLDNVGKSKTDGFYYWCKRTGQVEYSVVALTVAETMCNDTSNGIIGTYMIGDAWIQDNIEFKCRWTNSKAMVREIGCSSNTGIRLSIDEIFEIAEDGVAFICERFDGHYFYRQLTYDEYSDWKLEYSNSVSASGQKGHGSVTTIEEVNQNATNVRELTCNDTLIDLVIILDMSYSATVKNITLVKMFLWEIVESDLNCNGLTRFGILMYNDTTEKMILYRYLGEEETISSVEQSIEDIRFSTSEQATKHPNTASGEAFKTSKEILFVEENGCRRLEAIQTIFLITDAAGENKGGDPVEIASLLEKDSIYTYVLGIGITSITQLTYLTGIAGAQKNVFLAENITSLVQTKFIQDIVDSILTDLPEMVQLKNESTMGPSSSVQNITGNIPGTPTFLTVTTNDTSSPKPFPTSNYPRNTEYMPNTVLNTSTKNPNLSQNSKTPASKSIPDAAASHKSTPSAPVPQCPQDMEYSACGSSCEPFCEDPYETMYCITVCSPGCFCKPGYLQSADGQCIPQQECIDKAEKKTVCGAGNGPTEFKCGLGEPCPNSLFNCVRNNSDSVAGVCCPDTLTESPDSPSLIAELICVQSTIQYGEPLSKACDKLKIMNNSTQMEKVDNEVPRIVVIYIQKPLLIDSGSESHLQNQLELSCRPLNTQSCVLKMIPLHQAIRMGESLTIDLNDVDIECSHLKADVSEHRVTVVVNVDPFRTAYNNCITTTVDLDIIMPKSNDGYTKAETTSCTGMGSFTSLGYNGFIYQSDHSGTSRLIRYDMQGGHAKFVIANDLREDWYYSQLDLLKTYYEWQNGTCDVDEPQIGFDDTVFDHEMRDEDRYRVAMQNAIEDDEIAMKNAEVYMENITQFIDTVDLCLNHPQIVRVLTNMSCSYRRLLSAVLITIAKFEERSFEEKELRQKKKHGLENQLFRPAHIWLEDTQKLQTPGQFSKPSVDSKEICRHKKAQAAFLKLNLAKIHSSTPEYEKQLNTFQKRAYKVLRMVEEQEFFEKESEEDNYGNGNGEGWQSSFDEWAEGAYNWENSKVTGFHNDDWWDGEEDEGSEFGYDYSGYGESGNYSGFDDSEDYSGYDDSGDYSGFDGSEEYSGYDDSGDYSEYEDSGDYYSGYGESEFYSGYTEFVDSGYEVSEDYSGESANYVLPVKPVHAHPAELDEPVEMKPTVDTPEDADGPMKRGQETPPVHAAPSPRGLDKPVKRKPNQLEPAESTLVHPPYASSNEAPRIVVKRAKRSSHRKEVEYVSSSLKHDPFSALRSLSQELHNMFQFSLTSNEENYQKTDKERTTNYGKRHGNKKHGKEGKSHQNANNHKNMCSAFDITNLMSLVAPGSPASTCKLALPIYIWHEKNGRIYRVLYANGKIYGTKQIATCSCASKSTCTRKTKNIIDRITITNKQIQPKEVKRMVKEILDGRSHPKEDRGFGGEKRGPGGEKHGSGGEKHGFGGEKHGSGGEKRGSGGEKHGSGGEKRVSGGEKHGSGGRHGSGGEKHGSGGEKRGSGGRHGSGGRVHGFGGQKRGSGGEKRGSGGRHGSGGRVHGSGGQKRGSGGRHGSGGRVHGSGEERGSGGGMRSSGESKSHGFGTVEGSGYPETSSSGKEKGSSAFNIQIGVKSGKAGSGSWWDWFGNGVHSNETYSMGDVAIDTRGLADKMRKMIGVQGAFSSRHYGNKKK